MGLAEDIAIIHEQEKLLRFTAFTADTAWALGNVLHRMLQTQQAGGTIEIEIAGQLLFACATVGAVPGQSNWIRRKRNTVHHFSQSSYAVGRSLERDGETIESRHVLPPLDYASHGGGFPLWVQGACVGSVILSGLPQREDHEVVVAALAEVLGVKAPMLEAL